MPPAHRHAVAVFCGSRPGHDPAMREAAVKLGRGLAKAGHQLIYGGGRVGLMGALADSAIEAGGSVRGVIPDFLTRREVAHPRVSDLAVTDSMHSRKQLMFATADAFVVLPGGLGTFDETVEIITWRQLGLHEKPIMICNVGGWADALLATFHRAVKDGFAGEETACLFQVLPDVDGVLARLASLTARPGGAVGKM